MNIEKMRNYKKNENLTYERFAEKQVRLFAEWHVYYKEHSISQFESLINYRTGMFWDLVAGGDIEGEHQAKSGLMKILVNELRYQLENDKKNDYYNLELKNKQP